MAGRHAIPITSMSQRIKQRIRKVRIRRKVKEHIVQFDTPFPRRQFHNRADSQTSTTIGWLYEKPLR